jgi:hypothetical protein
VGRVRSGRGASANATFGTKTSSRAARKPPPAQIAHTVR